MSRGRAILYAAIGAAIVIAAVVAWNSYSIRSSVRWLAWAHRYKAEVLSRPDIQGELRHVEWDGWGGVPVGDWNAYVVFDPTDSLSVPASRHSSGKFAGIPCEVDEVRRLESQWYSVTLAMNQWWEQCK